MKKVIVWGAEGCGNCAVVFERLRAFGYDPKEYSVEDDLPRFPAAIRREVMSLVHYLDGALPIVQIDDAFFSAEEALARVMP